jgi:hypothetical protein
MWMDKFVNNIGVIGTIGRRKGPGVEDNVMPTSVPGPGPVANVADQTITSSNTTQNGQTKTAMETYSSECRTWLLWGREGGGECYRH